MAIVLKQFQRSQKMYHLLVNCTPSHFNSCIPTKSKLHLATNYKTFPVGITDILSPKFHVLFLLCMPKGETLWII